MIDNQLLLNSINPSNKNDQTIHDYKEKQHY